MINHFFVFDVESIGLYGEGFAVAGGIICMEGYFRELFIDEFLFACPPATARGEEKDRQWVKDNVPILDASLSNPRSVRTAFMAEWLMAKRAFPGIQMAAECAWPVEAQFLLSMIRDDPKNRQGPYPLHDIASFMAAAGMDPLKSYQRNPSELPAHSPLHDARQSARLLFEAISTINNK